MCHLDALVAPALAAYGYVAVIASDLYLFTFGNYLTITVDSGIDYRLATTVARRFHFLDGIGYLKEATRTLEQARLEIGAQSVAYYVAAIVVDNACELINLRF